MKVGLSNYMARQLQQPNGFFGSRFIGRMMNRSNAQLEQLSLASADVRPTDHVLEIGFGNGQLLEQLCSTVSSGKVMGADISQDLMDQVGKRFHSHIEKGRLELHLAGVSQLPLADASIDTIITNNTIYFWPQPLADSKELLRILKPNGKLVVGYRTADDMKNYPFVTQNLDIFKNRYSQLEVEQLLLQAGFRTATTKVEKGEMAVSYVTVAVR